MRRINCLTLWRQCQTPEAAAELLLSGDVRAASLEEIREATRQMLQLKGLGCSAGGQYLLLRAATLNGEGFHTLPRVDHHMAVVRGATVCRG